VREWHRNVLSPAGGPCQNYRQNGVKGTVSRCQPCFVSGYRFFFYSMEGAEPPHVHVEYGTATAKLWLDPVALAGSRGFRAHELNRIRLLVIQHRIAFKEAWDVHFGSEA